MDADTYAEAGGRATPEQMSRKHVYVVNGSPEFLDLVRELLQDEHYNVTTTNFVPQSFATIQTAQPDLLIIDLVLGEQAGWELLGALRGASNTSNIPVLLVSTTERLLDEARAHHEVFGGDRYLVKPFNLDELLSLVGELIGAA
jgi:DNA-binding response OmpR family regulator